MPDLVRGTSSNPRYVQSFYSHANKSAKILILGSMPGRASLSAGQYYAHARNLFWPFMQVILGIGTDLEYASRMRLLAASGVALWDVLQRCEREGSLDAAIVKHSEIPNDIPRMLEEYQNLQVIAMNGRAAQTALTRHFPGIGQRITLLPLPSTSPANASIGYDVKLAKWMELRHYL